MSSSFSITVTDISKKEFLCAVRWVCRFRDLSSLILAPLAFFIFICFLKGFSAAAIILPVLLLIVMAVYFEFTRINGYRQFPKDIKMVYEFNEQGWTLQVGENTGSSGWAEMVKLVERKHVFLLCHTKNSSNLLPKRCLTAEQIDQIRTWYRAAK